MQSFKKSIIYITGTGLGSGYAPFAPGTAGSLLGLFIYILFPADDITWLLVALIVTIIGIPVSTWIENDKSRDPAIVVIDEICGQWIALLFLPRTLMVFVAAFVLFRIFDIWKPFPISRSQNLRGGWGIMMDDVFAGIAANICLQLLLMTGVTL